VTATARRSFLPNFKGVVNLGAAASAMRENCAYMTMLGIGALLDEAVTMIGGKTAPSKTTEGVGEIDMV